MKGWPFKTLNDVAVRASGLRIMALHIALICSFLLSAQLFAADTSARIQRVDGWPSTNYSHVVGYSFDTGRAEPDSLVRTGKLDETRLKQFKQKEVSLTPTQIGRLLSATFGSRKRLAPAACYSPHHIFVFYDKNAKPVAAIEICFGCDNLRAMPSKDNEFHHDFADLARLSVELGLGLGAGTLDDYLKHLKEREAN